MPPYASAAGSHRFDTFVTDRVVDNQVNNLRKKIEPAPASPVYVRSVRNVGYRFDG